MNLSVMETGVTLDRILEGIAVITASAALGIAGEFYKRNLKAFNYTDNVRYLRTLNPRYFRKMKEELMLIPEYSGK